MDVSVLKGVVDFMRENGIQSLKTQQVELVLGPAPHQHVPKVESKIEKKTRVCACGCPATQHTNSGCMNACKQSVCNSTKTE